MKNARKFLSMTFRQAGLKIFIFVQFFGIFTVSPVYSDGRSLFEQAYKVEKSNPLEAAKLYKQSIGQGLTAELVKAARWRLYFLYRGEGLFLDAYDSLRRVSHKQSIADSLFEDIQSIWSLRKATFLDYSKVADRIEKQKSVSADDIDQLRRIYGQGSNKLRVDMDRWLKDRGFETASVQLVSADRNLSDAEAVIRTSSYFVDRNDPGKAEEALLPVLDSEKLTDSEKMRILYLLGRIERMKSDGNSAQMFRIAANYSSGKERNRQMALAAFSLYREGLREQAASLTAKIRQSDVDDNGMKLFLDVVAADVRNDADALARLKSRERSLRQEKGSYLAERALAILGRNR